ncbi:MAG: ABC transporter substrate-binding protein [Candidatus Woesebacteria bacterium]|nr:ABC transporter substrate-binding protein [Candidatus Woesebacteria bacterium]
MAFLVRFKWIFLLGTIFGILFFLSLNVFGSSIFQKGRERIGMVGRYRLDNLPNSILEYVSDGLTTINENGEIGPAISSSWENQDGGKTWIFHIADDTTWQDGKKIVSNDIQINFSDVTTEKPDSKTIVFKLQTPFSPFPAVLSKPIFKKGFLGTGEWKVKKVTVSGNIVEQIILSKSKEKDMIFKFYPTEERAKLALKLGEVDKLMDIFNPEPFDTWKTLDVQKKVNYGRFTAVFFNSAKEKITSDKTLRQVLAYAINKDVFPGTRALSPISPNSWAYNPQVKPYDYDLVKAKDMMKDLSKEILNNLSLNIATTPVLLAEAEEIAKNWRDLGITVNIQVISSIPENFDAFLAVLDIPRDPDQYSLWHSSQVATNISNYKNPRIDKLLEDGRTVTNESERKKIYLDFQRFLVEDSPAAFLYHPTSYTVTRK